MSNLLSAFNDAINVMKTFFNQNIGVSGITVIVCVLAVTALILFWSLCKEAIGKKKLVIKWGRLILLLIDVLVLIYFCLMY